MSSHHFVKEGQEPAVFIIDALSLELIEPLLEWAPLVMITDHVIDEAIRWGFKVDVVMAQKERHEEIAQKMEMQIPYSIVPYPANETSVHAAFAFLSERKQHAVHIISASSELFTVLNQYAESFDITILSESTRWSYSRHNKFEKWLPAGVKLQVVITKPQQQFEVQHLKFIETNSYETNRDGMVQIISADPFWVGE